MTESTNTIDRTLSIIEAVAHNNQGMTNSELSRKLKIPKSSASYILRVLERRGYLLREKESNRYRMGLKLMGLTRENLSHIDVREAARPAMEALMKRTGSSVHLAILDNGRAVYIEKVEAPSFVKMDIWVGHRLPVHTTAIGKALTANLPASEVVDMLRLHGMQKNTPKTIVTQGRFLKELVQVKKHGFAVDNEENAAGVRCIAAPIFDAQGKVIAAIGTSDTITRFDEGQLPKVVEAVKSAAGKISGLMGFS